MRRQSVFSESLRRESNSHDDFIARASMLITRQIFLCRPYRRSGKHLLDHLRSKGYCDADIAQALATAWADSAPEFYLDRRRMSDQLVTPFMEILLSLLLSLGTVLLGLYFLRRYEPELFIKALLFQIILLPLLGWTLGIAYHRMFRWLSRRGGHR